MDFSAATPNPLLSDAPHAWDELIQAVGPASLLVVIESRLGPALRRAATAEDVLQEALLHAWRDRAQCEWRGLRAFRAWLLMIIDHRIQHLAARQATQKRGAGLVAAALGQHGPDGDAIDSGLWGPAGSTTPSRVAIFREQAAAMHSALQAVPEDLRDVLHLRLFEQLTLEEIATRKGLSISAVRRRFGRGVELYEAALRAALVSHSRTHTDATLPATLRD